MPFVKEHKPGMYKQSDGIIHLANNSQRLLTCNLSLRYNYPQKNIPKKASDMSNYE